ncbi:hypothetical protein Q2589_004580 [Salmonella enterica]|nr:hypothetical protein [Salmonella enterica]EKB3332608.1 hypothetical protein [Salmonella enterica subsp. enterica serovar Chandans]EDZ5932842.1 hypothetical protein [Salmonella enterica]EEF5708303.1 hypothetical protein [Salmonella enterica]EFR3656793.1 hypothetical protein [Salmonella enterica]
MMTKRITLTREWYQLTDGTTEATIQFTDPVAVCRAEKGVKPDNHTPGMQFSNTVLTFTPPDEVWVRSHGLFRNVDIVVW